MEMEGNGTENAVFPDIAQIFVLGQGHCGWDLRRVDLRLGNIRKRGNFEKAPEDS